MPLSPDITQNLTAVYGDIAANFTFTEVPAGGAPEHLRRAWLGLTLPVRSTALGELALGDRTYFDELRQTEVPAEMPIAVRGIEAVMALADANKYEAVIFFREYEGGEFVFQASEGVLTRVDALI